jgi:K+-transporting ATPase KdpF subunit
VRSESQGVREVDFVIAGVVAIGVLIYLGYALFHPEEF